MRAAQSSSNDRLPRGGWARTWALTMLLVIIPLAAWEIRWRTRGFAPEVTAVDESWILALHEVASATTVALGTSRIQAALDPEAFQHAFGGAPPVDLALPGNSPIPMLEYLADSTRYAGLVIVEILPLYAFDAEQGGARRLNGLLGRYARDRVSPARLSENWLEVHLLQHLVFRRAELLPSQLVTTLRNHGRVEPGVSQARADRFAPVHERRLLARHEWDAVTGFHGLVYGAVERGGRPADDAEYAVLKDRILRAAGHIMDRGGTIVLLNMSACGERRLIEERRYPRARYWDPLATEFAGVAIATADYPELSRFACWDGSHLDAADAPAFAGELGHLLRTRLSQPTGSSPTRP